MKQFYITLRQWTAFEQTYIVNAENIDTARTLVYAENAELDTTRASIVGVLTPTISGQSEAL